MTPIEIAELIYRHALQGQTEPRFAKDQCWEIEQLAATLITVLGKE